MEKLKLDTIVTKFKNGIFRSDSESIVPLKPGIFMLVVIAVSAAMIQFGKPEQKREQRDNSVSMDTYIPAGQSLVPIQVANYESLDQVIGQFGVVDLHSTPLSPAEKPKRIAYAVKLVRSPRNPRHFNVLVPADEAHKLAGYHGEFTVAVRNPKLIGTKFVKKKAKRTRRRVVYETESI